MMEMILIGDLEISVDQTPPMIAMRRLVLMEVFYASRCQKHPAILKKPTLLWKEVVAGFFLIPTDKRLADGSKRLKN